MPRISDKNIEAFRDCVLLDLAIPSYEMPVQYNGYGFYYKMALSFYKDRGANIVHYSVSDYLNTLNDELFHTFMLKCMSSRNWVGWFNCFHDAIEKRKDDKSVWRIRLFNVLPDKNYNRRMKEEAWNNFRKKVRTFITKVIKESYTTSDVVQWSSFQVNPLMINFVPDMFKWNPPTSVQKLMILEQGMKAVNKLGKRRTVLLKDIMYKNHIFVPNDEEHTHANGKARAPLGSYLELLINEKPEGKLLTNLISRYPVLAKQLENLTEAQMTAALLSKEYDTRISDELATAFIPKLDADKADFIFNKNPLYAIHIARNGLPHWKTALAVLLDVKKNAPFGILLLTPSVISDAYAGGLSISYVSHYSGNREGQLEITVDTVLHTRKVYTLHYNAVANQIVDSFEGDTRRYKKDINVRLVEFEKDDKLSEYYKGKIASLPIAILEGLVKANPAVYTMIGNLVNNKSAKNAKDEQSPRQRLHTIAINQIVDTKLHRYYHNMPVGIDSNELEALYG